MLLSVLKSAFIAVVVCISMVGCGRIEKSGDTLNAEFEGQFPAPLMDSRTVLIETGTQAR